MSDPTVEKRLEILRADIQVNGLLIHLLWVDTLRQMENPKAEAQRLKETCQSSLKRIKHFPDHFQKEYERYLKTQVEGIKRVIEELEE